jgi:hypothetical protein
MHIHIYKHISYKVLQRVVEVQHLVQGSKCHGPNCAGITSNFFQALIHMLPAAKSLEQQASSSRGQSIRVQDCQDQDALPVIKLKTITVLPSVVPWHACHQRTITRLSTLETGKPS